MTEEPETVIGDMDPAELLERAAAAFKAGEKEDAAKMYNTVGNIYMSVAEFEEAHKCFLESKKIYTAQTSIRMVNHKLSSGIEFKS